MTRIPYEQELVGILLELEALDTELAERRKVVKLTIQRYNDELRNVCASSTPELGPGWTQLARPDCLPKKEGDK